MTTEQSTSNTLDTSSDQGIASRLRGSAEMLEEADRSRLEDLARSIETPGDLSWAGAQPLLMFSRSSQRASEALSGVAAILELVRDALIFAPIGVTWTGIAMAARAYRAVQGREDLAGRTFLSLWLSGFQGELNPLFRLDIVALIDGFLIGAVLMLTVVLGLLQVQRARHQAASTAIRETEFQAALADAELELSRRRLSIEPPVALVAAAASIDRIVSELAAGLKSRRADTEAQAAVVKQLNDTTAAFGRALSTVQGAVAKLDAASQAAQARIPKLAGTAERIDGTASSLDQAAVALAEALRKTEESSGRNVTLITELLAKASETLARAEAWDGRISGAFTQSADEQVRLLGVLRSEAEGHREAAAALVGTAIALERTLRTVAEQTPTMRGLATDVQLVVRALSERRDGALGPLMSYSSASIERNPPSDAHVVDPAPNGDR